jgi:SAM-dependent methyltransferase
MNSLRTASIGEELLDDPAADPAVVRSSLRHIARSNRWFGGRSAVRFGLSRVLAGVARGTTLSLLDVGTGFGDLPLDALRWGKRQGIAIIPFGLDRSFPAAHLAADQGVTSMVGCAGALPVRDRSVDLVLVSQVTHHLRHDSAVQLIRECSRIARYAVMVTDLERARLAMVGFWLGSRMLGFDTATRADGLTSIRRGYTPEEFHQLFLDAEVPVRTYRRPAYRLVALWKTS